MYYHIERLGFLYVNILVRPLQSLAFALAAYNVIESLSYHTVNLQNISALHQFMK